MALVSKGSPRGWAAGRILSALLALGVVAGAGSVRAQITTLEPTKTATVEEEAPFPFIMVGLTGFGGLNTFGMQGVNQSLTYLNPYIIQPGVRYQPFNGGPSLGGGLRAILKERIIVEADLDHLGTSQEIGGIVANSKFSLPADGYLLTLGYDLLSSRNVGFGVEAGGGYYKAKGQQVLTETNAQNITRTLGTLNLDGHGIGAHAGAYLEASLSKHIWVNFFAGYRNAKVKDVDITGLDKLQPAQISEATTIDVPVAICPDCPGIDLTHRDFIPDSIPPGATVTMWGGNRTIDWSGFMGRMAFTYYLNAPGD